MACHPSHDIILQCSDLHPQSVCEQGQGMQVSQVMLGLYMPSATAVHGPLFSP